MRYAILIGTGAVVLVVGVVLFASSHVSLGDHEAEGRMPASLAFAADERNHSVGVTKGFAGDVRCRVRRSDGSTKTLTGHGDGEVVGSFDAPTGLTRVGCDWKARPSGRPVAAFVAQEKNGLRTVAVLVIAFGAALLGAGLWPLARARLSGA